MVAVHLQSSAKPIKHIDTNTKCHPWDQVSSSSLSCQHTRIQVLQARSISMPSFLVNGTDITLCCCHLNSVEKVGSLWFMCSLCYGTCTPDLKDVLRMAWEEKDKGVDIKRNLCIFICPAITFVSTVFTNSMSFWTKDNFLPCWKFNSRAIQL